MRWWWSEPPVVDVSIATASTRRTERATVLPFRGLTYNCQLELNEDIMHGNTCPDCSIMLGPRKGWQC